MTYGRISYVEAGSPADKAGLRPGDELVSINSQTVRDILDYRFLSSEEQVVLVVERDSARYACFIFKGADEDLGLEFDEELFGGVRNCRNNCIFCFLHQMPRGLRKSLYVRDDDYRLSFAHGNYITLTNLSDEDVDRICTQKMSPLYISVHSTDPDLRERMMRNENAGRVMDYLRRFAEARIAMHTQIVLCPGWNDGEHLERTVKDLASLHPRVESIAIVPVGLTKHRARLTPLTGIDGVAASEVVRSCSVWQREFEEEHGTRLVFPSDEFYIRAGVDFPSDDEYEGYPQLEDGIGVSRLFLDELDQVRESGMVADIPRGRYVLVTGTLAAPMVGKFADLLNTSDEVEVRVLVVSNEFLGESVTVAGLLAGRDVVSSPRDLGRDEIVLIPEVALNEEEHFLDDMTLSELREMVDARVIAVPASPAPAVEKISAGAETDEDSVFCVECAGT